jgi:hypothetical protein
VSNLLRAQEGNQWAVVSGQYLFPANRGKERGIEELATNYTNTFPVVSFLSDLCVLCVSVVKVLLSVLFVQFVAGFTR